MSVRVLLASLLILSACGLAVAQEAAEETGTIAAKLSSPYARRGEGVVFIKEAKGEFKPPKENPKMDQQKLVFIPNVLPILVGTTIDFPNNDVVRHNVFSSKKSVEQFNLGTYSTGVTKQRAFEKVGFVQLLCNVHAEMSAFIIICQNPYFAVTDKKTSSAEIKNVPPGEYELTFWHQMILSKTVKITVKAGETTAVTFSGLSRKR